MDGLRVIPEEERSCVDPLDGPIWKITIEEMSVFKCTDDPVKSHKTIFMSQLNAIYLNSEPLTFRVTNVTCTCWFMYPKLQRAKQTNKQTGGSLVSACCPSTVHVLVNGFPLGAISVSLWSSLPSRRIMFCNLTIKRGTMVIPLLMHASQSPSIAPRLYTRLYNFARNISTNISTLGQCTHLKLGELSLFIVYNITISWLT